MSGETAIPCVSDGELVRSGRVELGATAEGLAYGEGIFETLPVVDGRPKFLGAHVRRMDEAARAVGLGPGPDEAAVRNDAALLSAASGFASWSLRLALFRDGARVRRLATASPFPKDAGRPVRLGLVASEFNGPRTLARLKTLNCFGPRLAHREASLRGLDEALFTMHDGTVLEGTRSSVFIVERGVLTTPPLSLPILPGVTRDVILAAARAGGVEVREEPFLLPRLLAADEAFISASVRGLRAASEWEGRPLGASPGGGPLTETLRRAYLGAFAAD